MTFKDYLPAFVVAGYALAGLLGWLRGRIGFRGQKPVTVAIWMLVVATSLFWLVAGAGLTGTITVLAIFVVLPFAVIFVSQVLGRARRRRAGDENLAPIWPAVLLAIGALAFCIPAANLILNGLCSLVGLDHNVDLLVTATEDTSAFEDGAPRTVSGEYLLDGTRVFVDRSWWFAFGPLPAEGDTIAVSVAPMWPYSMYESTWSTVLMTLFGVALLIPGVPLALLALRERGKVA
ncbi:hypothetical protein [Amycolatopsis sp. YIM 10]|uniref:hypothetical protein n=1 Tax=Amycolatopsis sp. YIM 10 TaxID=2653857 RepID=UPI0012900EBA|nr:hypothetical protein [Amycolatopsis sp. YIM 10]QFU94012.1 hypothetical protein YIM_44390 [Amycolatopsis sp. YIM 10]